MHIAIKTHNTHSQGMSFYKVPYKNLCTICAYLGYHFQWIIFINFNACLLLLQILSSFRIVSQWKMSVQFCIDQLCFDLDVE